MFAQTGSKARLRTRTGCSTCRQRKKKCDEIKPICARCSTASFHCSWPELAPDGRQKPSGPFTKASDLRVFAKAGNSSSSTKASGSSQEISRSAVSIFSPQAADSWFTPDAMDTLLDNFELQGFMDLMISWSPHTPSTAVVIGEDEWLFEYWWEQWLPSLVHKHSHPRYLDFSYIRAMALEHAPLMETALACAAVSQYHKDSEDPDWMVKMRDKALTHQTTAVAGFRDAMSSGNVDGTEDWVLATVLGLTLFDNRDPKCAPAKAGTHVAAIRQLFKVRELSKSERGQPDFNESRLAFERMHYEYLIYHSTVFMIWDPTLDTLIGNSVWTTIESYFLTSPLPVDIQPENWPVLGTPYKLHRLIIAISRLGRRCPLSSEDLSIASAVWEEMLLWPDLSDVSVGTLYVLAAKILLQQILSHHVDSLSLRAVSEADTQSLMQLFDKIDIGPHFSRSLVWPLTILWATVTKVEDKYAAREKMRTVLQKADGGGPLSITEERLDTYFVIPGIPALVPMLNEQQTLSL